MQLQPTAPSSRLLALLRQREKLEASAVRKRRDLERARERARQLQSTITGRVAPLTVELFELDRDLHALFAALLAKGRLIKAARRTVQEVYRHLIRSGLLSDGDALDPEQLAEFKASVSAGAGSAGGGAGPGVPPPWAPTEDAESAQRPAGPGTEAIRALYRRLVQAIHPDRAQSEAERERRTEAMKVVTRAYGDGDLARLLEVERAWLAEEPASVAEPEGALDDKCASLERTNAALGAQVKALQSELRAISAFPPHREVQGFATASPRVFAQRLEEMVSESAEGVAQLKAVRDHIVAFRDGKISLAEFEKGPPGLAGGDVDEEDLEEGLELLMALDGLEASLRRRGPRPQRAGSRRSPARRKR